jgi:hypothetical protein
VVTVSGNVLMGGGARDEVAADRGVPDNALSKYRHTRRIKHSKTAEGSTAAVLPCPPYVPFNDIVRVSNQGIC